MDASAEFEELRREVESCVKCPLHKSRKRPVLGEGNLNAEVMVIGEAPGAVEDEEGRPFVGPAGRLLTALLNEIGVKREELYITNVVKCRPPNNRDPEESEIEACLPYLIRQIKLIRPRKIVALGIHSTRTILRFSGIKVDELSRFRGRVFRVSINGVEAEVYPTYHPAAALYNPKLRGIIKNDLENAFKGKVRQGALDEYLK